MSGDASWWTSVVDGMPAAGTRVLCLTVEGRVVILDAAIMACARGSVTKVSQEP